MESWSAILMYQKCQIALTVCTVYREARPLSLALGPAGSTPGGGGKGVHFAGRKRGSGSWVRVLQHETCVCGAFPQDLLSR